ncbi:MAG: S1 RNA-binding domain-containing protein [Anaerolineae bacterium]|nr:S1 RNA-binding domain-containing protein [Anaerolineae bacterium]
MSEELTPMSEETTQTVMSDAELDKDETAETEAVAAEAEEVTSASEPVTEAVEAPAAESTEAAAVAEEAPAAEAEAAPVAESTEAPVVSEAEDASEAETAELPATESAAEAPAAEASAPVATPKSMAELQPGMELTGTVKRIELYGAFVDLGIGKDGLLHISQLGKADVRNVEDVVQVGQQLHVFVLKVDKDQGRIALSLNKPLGMPWEALRQGEDVTGTVVKIENFGVFVDFGAERPGMIHVSELASGYVRSPEDVVSVGQSVTARIIKLDRRKKRIDLSLKAISEKVAEPEIEEEEAERLPTAMEVALRRAMQNGDPEKARIAQKRARRNRKDNEMEDIISRTLRSHQNQK